VRSENSIGDFSAPAHAEGTDQFRERLLNGMAGAVRERGYIDTTISDIVRHAYTSRRTFYEYFPGKKECFLALHHRQNAELARKIVADLDPHAALGTQVRQAIRIWVASVAANPAIELSWIREMSQLGEEGRQAQREFLEAFIAMVRSLTDTEDLRAAGVRPASRHTAIMLLGGLNELAAVTLEDGGDVHDITEAAVDCTLALLGPRS
jgi:AcrR family transcriptional regulator